jgi:hypothetical protein
MAHHSMPVGVVKKEDGCLVQKFPTFCRFKLLYFLKQVQTLMGVFSSSHKARGVCSKTPMGHFCTERRRKVIVRKAATGTQPTIFI